MASAQIRAARGLVRWSAEDLAKQARLGLATIRRAEQSDMETSLTAANELAVRRTLEAAGVEFIDENGGAASGSANRGIKSRRTEDIRRSSRRDLCLADRWCCSSRRGPSMSRLLLWTVISSRDVLDASPSLKVRVGTIELPDGRRGDLA
jgi:transcriptional regulator with XRE-family HTH domain